MRTFLVLIVALLILCTVDLAAFHGHYTKATWEEARDHGRQLSNELDYQLKRFGWR